MKKNKYILLGIAALLLLPSCSMLGKTDPVVGEVTFEINDDGTKSYKHPIDTAKMLSNSGIEAMAATGEQKLLVVPIVFQNSDPINLFMGYGSPHEALDKMFFGKSEETYWESVSSYYYKSSYGQLKLSGEVAPDVALEHDLNYYLRSSDSAYKISSSIAEQAIKQLESTGFNTAAYDQNNDGYIDAVWFVYNVPYSTGANANDLTWAFTTSSSRSQSSLATKVKTFGWASYYFMAEDSLGLPDAHTFIHETGHILGLDDYYNYDNDSAFGMTFPLGGLDMMDYNIGDHTAFSKYLLNWINPREIVKPGEYRLDKFTASGDALLISPSFNGTPFDEYLLLEYYTPDGLNAQDATEPYSNIGTTMFTVPGLRITHVDNRLGDVKIGTFTGATWSGNYYDNIEYYVKNDKKSLPIASNTPSFNYDRKNVNNRLIELVSGRFKLATNTLARDYDLFQLGGELMNFSYHDGNVLPYTISVKEMTSDYMTILIKD